VRRKTVLALGLVLGVGSVTLPLVARAQPTGRIYRIGVLSLTSFEGTTLGKVMAEGLDRRGYVVGQNTVIEDKFADGNPGRLPALAAELVGLKVDLIVATPSRGGS